MTRDEFGELFEKCTKAALEFARQYVVEDLPEEVIYLIKPNQSCDEGPLELDEVVFPGESLANLRDSYTTDLVGTIDFLYREGKVPEWVDVSVVGVDERFSHVELLCCGRFTSNESRWYYAKQGQGPFGIRSPPLPANHKSLGGTKFSLNRA
jgi:hypothetical protein